MIRFKCPRCQSVLDALDEWAESKMACPHCGQALLIPKLSVPAAPPMPAPTSKTTSDPIPEVLPATRRIALKGLHARNFQHPLDREATDSLGTFKGFRLLVAKFMEYGIESQMYVDCTGSNIRVTPRQYPKLCAMLRECCYLLDMPEPALYVKQTPDVNARTSGHNNPFIIVHTGLLDLMEDDEVMAVLAHELGHIKCGHVLYMQMARYIGPFLLLVGQGTMGLGRLLGMGIEGALLLWSRRAELSADRAALLAVQDVCPCLAVLMKLAGGSRRYADQLDPDQFLNQARAYREGMDQNSLHLLYRLMINMNIDHPVPVERARALDEYAASRDYQDILRGKFIRHKARPNREPLEEPKSRPHQQKNCPSCGRRVGDKVKFCPQCFTPVGM
jgi:Zn-dependent protease with chaperone function